MPINQWNWYRAVGTGNDHKTWLSDNREVDISSIAHLLFLLSRLMMDEMGVTLVLRTVIEVNMRTSAVT